MNSFEILQAMTEIPNDYILSVRDRLGYDRASAVKYRRPLRRAAALIAAVIIMLTACFTTAFAASPEFRELVFRFFHIEQEEVIPESTVDTELSADDMFAEPSISIGDVIEGKYVHTPVATQAESGVFLVCTDEIETNQGSHYDAYYEENGEFIKLEEHSFCQDYTLMGMDFHVEFDWAAHNENVIVTWSGENDFFRMPGNAGDPTGVLCQFLIISKDEHGSYEESYYPVLLNLHTGVMTDLLAGTGAEKLSHIVNSAISEDRAKLLLCQSTVDGSILYYVDLTAKQMHRLDELSGEPVDACTLIGNTMTCWSQTAGCYSAWTLDLSTFQRTDLFDSVPNAAVTTEADAGIVFLTGFDDWIHEGNMYTGSIFALEVNEAQSISVIDLATGEKMPIEGYIWTPNTQRIPSPDGKKLLLAGGPDGQDFEYVGVLDFGNMTFAEFSRDNPLDEYLAYWFDGNTIIIRSEVNPNSMCSDYYLYNLIH